MKVLRPRKGEFLQRKGEFNTRVYYIKSGLLRSYAIDQKGKEHIFMFGSEGWTLGDSVSPDQPSELFIQALEDSVVMVWEKRPDTDQLDSQRLLKRLLALQNRVLMLMSSSASERYAFFIQTYPKLLDRVPQKMIASYLGITPETLSKVRNERSRGK